VFRRRRNSLKPRILERVFLAEGGGTNRALGPLGLGLIKIGESEGLLFVRNGSLCKRDLKIIVIVVQEREYGRVELRFEGRIWLRPRVGDEEEGEESI